ncbi:MAG: Hint domain-containing protein [Planctomycetota bacterium]
MGAALRMVPLGVCFVAGTLVLTPNGAEAIETIDVGERVLTTDVGSPAAISGPTDPVGGSGRFWSCDPVGGFGRF